MTLTIDINDVRSVYSGKPGCCCGCRGKHTVNPVHRAEAEKARGYKVDEGACNASVVRRHVATIQQHAEHGTATIEVSPTHVAAMTEDRWWIAYFVD